MRVLILGVPGSGKTTLARRLSQELGIVHIEVDALDWRSPDFRRELCDLLIQPHWVVEGHFSKIQDLVLEKADHIIWLKPSIWTTYYRCIRRSIFGEKSLSQIWWGLKDTKKRMQTFSQVCEEAKARGLSVSIGKDGTGIILRDFGKDAYSVDTAVRENSHS